MKTDKIFALSLLLLCIIFACRKSDNPRLPDLERAPTISFSIDPTADLSISVTTPEQAANFHGKFSMYLPFPDNSSNPVKADIVVRKTQKTTSSITGNDTTVYILKTFKADQTTFPTNFEVTGQQLIDLFDDPIRLGETFTFGADAYTKEGKKFEAFPAIGASYGSGVEGEFGNVKTTAAFSAICAYDPAIFVGNFVVEEDEWADYSPGDVISITKIDDTHISFKHVAAIDAVPVIIQINPADNSAQVAKQSVGSRWAYGPQYTAPFVSATGSVLPCDETIDLTVTYGFSGGTFVGTYALVLKKQ